MPIFRINRGKITHGSRTGEKYILVNVLCFEFAWKYPWSASWRHSHLKAALFGFEWVAWKKVEVNSYYDWSAHTFGDWIADPEAMKAAYDKDGPHDLTPLAKFMGMDVLYRPESPNYKGNKPSPWMQYLYSRQKQRNEGKEPQCSSSKQQ